MTVGFIVPREAPCLRTYKPGGHPPLQCGRACYSLFAFRLFGFHRNAMLIGIGIMANTGDLPGHFQCRPSAADTKVVSGNFACHVDRRVSADAGELVTKILVYRLE